MALDICIRKSTNDALSLFIFNFLPNTTAIVGLHSFPNFSTTEPHNIEINPFPSRISDHEYLLMSLN